MEIWFSNKGLRDDLVDDTRRVRKFGAPNAKKLLLRLLALKAAETLADFEPGTPPERCHELKGDMAGTFSIDVKQPFRLLFRPKVHADPRPPDLKAYWKSITEIEIIDVRDTHG